MSSITIPKVLPSPEEDSKKLRKAFSGWGTDENAIIEVLGHRNSKQRAEIARTYYRLYKESLVDSLKSELSGDFGRAVILWALDPAERDAKLVNEALNNSKNKVYKRLLPIVEIACASSPDHLMAVRKAYCSLYNFSLEENIQLQLAQNQSWTQLLVRLVSSYRYNGEDIDDLLAKSEAAKLHNAIRSNQHRHEDITRILATRSKPYLRATFEYYNQDYGRTIEKDIEASRSSDKILVSLLKDAVRCLYSPERHFAEVVRNSIVGLGTDEDSLTRAIVMRAEVDMKKIKEEYKRFGTSINDDIIGDTSGAYMNFLLTLVG